MNRQAAIAAVVAVVVGIGVGYALNLPGRYQIISSRAPTSKFLINDQAISSAAGQKIDPNDPGYHRTIMLDTATGKTWELQSWGTPLPKVPDAEIELWYPLGYYDAHAPNNHPTQPDPQ